MLSLQTSLQILKRAFELYCNAFLNFAMKFRMLQSKLVEMNRKGAQIGQKGLKSAGKRGGGEIYYTVVIRIS